MVDPGGRFTFYQRLVGMGKGLLFPELKPFLQIFCVHDGTEIYFGVQLCEKGLGDERDFGGIFQIEDHEAGPAAIKRMKVTGFRPEFLHR